MKKKTLRKVHVFNFWIQPVAQLITIITTIVVGVWGCYSTIHIKKEKEITDYTLKELKQKTTQTPHIQAKIQPIIERGDGGLIILVVKVTLSNLGNKESRVTFDDNSLALIPVELSHGKPVFEESINLLSGRYTGNLHRLPLPFVDIGAGETYEFTFAHGINKTGTYLIHFLALNGIAPSQEVISATNGLHYKYSVGADEYLVIK
ncbi:hypothetical protein ACTV70_002874 [Cronobacter dublinensis]